MHTYIHTWTRKKNVQPSLRIFLSGEHCVAFLPEGDRYSTMHRMQRNILFFSFILFRINSENEYPHMRALFHFLGGLEMSIIIYINK